MCVPLAYDDLVQYEEKTPFLQQLIQPLVEPHASHRRLRGVSGAYRLSGLARENLHGARVSPSLTPRDWYLNPQTRTNMVLRWEPFVKQALCYKPVDHKIHPQRDLVLPDGKTYDEFRDPMFTLARHALGCAAGYADTLKSKQHLINPSL